MRSITPTEKKILELIAEGFSTKDVSLVLAMSKFTVLSHRRNLPMKFGARNSAELVRRAIQNKEIEIYNRK